MCVFDFLLILFGHTFFLGGEICDFLILLEVHCTFHFDEGYFYFQYHMFGIVQDYDVLKVLLHGMLVIFLFNSETTNCQAFQMRLYPCTV